MTRKRKKKKLVKNIFLVQPVGSRKRESPSLRWSGEVDENVRIIRIGTGGWLRKMAMSEKGSLRRPTV